MTKQRLTAFEQEILATFAAKAGLAAALLEAWADLPTSSVQSVRSLLAAAQLGVTEESATQTLLECLVCSGLIETAPTGFRPRTEMHRHFSRIAFALQAIEHYRSSIHEDSTSAQLALTKPAQPSVLEEKLSELGWRTTTLEPTNHAFLGLVRGARRRVVVMTPFFDGRGAKWLRELLSQVNPRVERILILRSLEDPTRADYPSGFDDLRPWLKANDIRIYNYSIPRTGGGRETFHAKTVVCDRSAAYLGSSNMTAASLEYSMELGVVLKGCAATGVADIVDAVLATATNWL
jgi:phosphatidylserine/phosphatidylglycerophosphate/cardiolipin synthase-like enzyme